MNNYDYIEKGRQLIKSGEYEAAKEVLTEYLKTNLHDSVAIVALVGAEYSLGNYHKALYLLNDLNKSETKPEISGMIDTINRDIAKFKINEKLITVSFIVKNEEQSLPNALKSVENIADEIIVVDTGSTDRTVDVAKAAGAKIYYFDWVNDYSAARNISIKYATSKWILYLDADERLSPQSADVIRQSAEQADTKTGGLVCEIISNYYKSDDTLDVYSGQYPRFFRNIGYPVLHFFGKVHEQITPSYAEKGYELAPSPLVILHDGYAIRQEALAEKLNKHLKTLSEHINSEPENGYAWYHLGNTFYQMKRYAESRPLLENSIKCGNLSNFLSANTSLLLSRVDEQLGDMRSAFNWADKALSYKSNYEFALIRKAEILEKLGLLDKFIKK